MKAVILSAGQGKRLLPLTETTPKCLIELSGRSVLEWQIKALAEAGIDEIVVVIGFGAEQVEAELRRVQAPGVAVRTLYNPFFGVSDNLASCWIARAEMNGPFLLLNGDTLFEPAIAARVLDAPMARDIQVTIDRKAAYDSDDMKVSTADGVLAAIGKTLPAEIVDGESIGMLRFSAQGAAAFVAAVEAALKGDALKLWYLSIIDRLAKASGQVGVVSIEGLAWGEMDFPADFKRNERMTRDWVAAQPGFLAAVG